MFTLSQTTWDRLRGDTANQLHIANTGWENDTVLIVTTDAATGAVTIEPQYKPCFQCGKYKSQTVSTKWDTASVYICVDCAAANLEAVILKKPQD